MEKSPTTPFATKRTTDAQSVRPHTSIVKPYTLYKQCGNSMWKASLNFPHG
jgi:hypothetical protein